jgi:hydroxypyruvate reductase
MFEKTMKETLRRLFLSTLSKLSVEQVMTEKVRCQKGVLSVGGEQLELGPFKKIIGVSIGKAALPMTRALSEILKPHTMSGVVVSPAHASDLPQYFLHYVGGHPYPDRQSFHAADVVLELLSDLKKHHLVIYLLSGGGSALCEKPVAEEISLEDSRAFFRLLVTCGANIVEMNVLRKHFSAIKGGQLAARANPARQMTLYISDVPVDKPSTVASGPTMPDESSVEDCYEIVERLGLLDKLPAPIRSMFHDQRIPETPKPGAEVFRTSSWHCLLDNQAGLNLLRAQADAQGWVVDQDLSVDDTPLQQAVDRLLARLENLRSQNPGRTVALLTGGELSWPVTGDGQGGRNQAFVLDCARKIAGRNVAVVSAGTDGIDGNSAAAGAVADGKTLERAAKLGLDAADFQLRSDSCRFFEALDDLIVTGPTGNNVRDLRLLVQRQ